MSNGTSAEVYHLYNILKAREEREHEDEGDEGEGEDWVCTREGLLGDGLVRVIKNCHTKTITCLALSPDTNVLVTCSMNGEVKFWDLGNDNDDDDGEGDK